MAYPLSTLCLVRVVMDITYEGSLQWRGRQTVLAARSSPLHLVVFAVACQPNLLFACQAPVFPRDSLTPYKVFSRFTLSFP